MRIYKSVNIRRQAWVIKTDLHKIASEQQSEQYKDENVKCFPDFFVNVGNRCCCLVCLFATIPTLPVLAEMLLRGADSKMD